MSKHGNSSRIRPTPVTSELDFDVEVAADDDGPREHDQCLKYGRQLDKKEQTNNLFRARSMNEKDDEVHSIERQLHGERLESSTGRWWKQCRLPVVAEDDRNPAATVR